MTTQTSPIHVLMVEDDAEDVVLTKESLTNSKVTLDLHVVEDGEEALLYLRKTPPYASVPRPDVILLDLNLPKKNGREVLSEMQQDIHLRSIPVIVLTTSDQEEDVLKTYELGANCYITKPVGLDQFMKVVNAIDNFWFSIVKLPSRK
ncbi:MAG: two-component system response regulator [Nitrospirales bacterium]|nr:MAG: two-component system response regulator [Nitrospirales bacterium]